MSSNLKAHNSMVSSERKGRNWCRWGHPLKIYFIAARGRILSSDRKPLTENLRWNHIKWQLTLMISKVSRINFSEHFLLAWIWRCDGFSFDRLYHRGIGSILLSPRLALSLPLALLIRLRKSITSSRKNSSSTAVFSHSEEIQRVDEPPHTGFLCHWKV